MVITSDVLPSEAQNAPTTKEKIINQISKTGNTPFVFENIELDLDENIFIPVSCLNELRRNALEKLQQNIIEKEISSRNLVFNYKKEIHFEQNSENIFLNKNTCINKKINLLLNVIDNHFDYTTLIGIDKIYIPLKFFLNKDLKIQIDKICNNFDTYIYMPNIIRDTLKINFDDIINNTKLKGIVISSINQIDILKKYNLELIGNYTLNVYNSHTINTLSNMGITELCITPELNNEDTKKLISNSQLPLELMVYGRIPFMTINYCLLGKTNKCYKECTRLCSTPKKFYIKDRLGLDFRIVPDNISTITTIYNSKITSFDYSEFNVNSVRISILDENASDIQNIINTIKQSKRFEGNEFCRTF